MAESFRRFRSVVLELMDLRISPSLAAEGWTFIEKELIKELQEWRGKKGAVPSVMDWLAARVVAKAASYDKDAMTAVALILDRTEGPVTQKIEQKMESFVAELPGKMDQKEWSETFGPPAEEEKPDA